MAKATKEEIAAAIASYVEEHPGTTASYDESTDSHLLKDAGGVEAIYGPGMKCGSDVLAEYVAEKIMGAREDAKGSRMPECKACPPSVPSRARNGQGGALAKPDMPIRDIQVAEMTCEDIRQYLCPAANDRDLYMFLRLCQARNLNPFCNEAYLIPYKDGKTGEIKCSMVVGKEAFMRVHGIFPAYLPVMCVDGHLKEYAELFGEDGRLLEDVI